MTPNLTTTQLLVLKAAIEADPVLRGKEAKRIAGDMSRHWSAAAVIEGL